jgi:hypothetical protein
MDEQIIEESREEEENKEGEDIIKDEISISIVA